MITDCREQLRCAVRKFGDGSEQANAIEEDLSIFKIEKKASHGETEVMNALSFGHSSVSFLRGLHAILEHWKLGDSYQRILDATDESTIDWDREVIRAAQAILSHRETEGSRFQEQEALNVSNLIGLKKKYKGQEQDQGTRPREHDRWQQWAQQSEE